MSDDEYSYIEGEEPELDQYEENIQLEEGTYEGMFTEYGNKKLPHGFGTMVYKNGDKYTGEWSYGKMDGKGVFVRDDVEYKSDNWEDGKAEINGKILQYNKHIKKVNIFTPEKTPTGQILFLYHLTTPEIFEKIIKNNKLYTSNTLAYKGLIDDIQRGGIEKIISASGNSDYIGVYTRIMPTTMVGKVNPHNESFGNIILVLDKSLLKRADFHYNSRDNLGHISNETVLSKDFEKNQKWIVNEIETNVDAFTNNELVFHNSIPINDFLLEVRIVDGMKIPRSNQFYDTKKIEKDVNRILSEYKIDVDIVVEKLNFINDLSEKAKERSKYISTDKDIHTKLQGYKPNFCYYLRKIVDKMTQIPNLKEAVYMAQICGIEKEVNADVSNFMENADEKLTKQVEKNIKKIYFVKQEDIDEDLIYIYFVKRRLEKKLLDEKYKETDFSKIKKDLESKGIPPKLLLESKSGYNLGDELARNAKNIDYVALKSFQNMDSNNDYEFGKKYKKPTKGIKHLLEKLEKIRNRNCRRSGSRSGSRRPKRSSRRSSSRRPKRSSSRRPKSSSKLTSR